ncbi:MAG: sialidase family protein [Phycisphaerales bacterium]
MGLVRALEAQAKPVGAVRKMADAAPAAWAGPAPALTDEQKAALGEGGAAAPAPAVPPAAPAQPAAAPEPKNDAPKPVVPAAPARVNVPDVPPERAEIVMKRPDGVPAVAEKNGKPFDGVKVSKYDAEIFSPQLACAPDGTLHLAFVERQATTPFAYFVFHRQSTDGGKTWSEAKNLSEVMPQFNVGYTRLCVDAQGRAYVIWRSSLKENFPVLATAAGNGQHNLVYRVLENGKWSKVLYVHKPGSPETQNDGSCSYMAVTDASGKVQVIWNSLPDMFDPQKYAVPNTVFVQHASGIGRGLVFQATLDGTAAAQPRQLFCANFHEKPAEGKYGKYCDDLDSIEGYCDAAGTPRFIAWVRGEAYPGSDNQQYCIYDGAVAKPVVKIPHWYSLDGNPPKLLVDAAGKEHVIALYPAGEQQSFRDYVVGSDEEPTTIMSAKAPKGTAYGCQAFQGPNGKMIVLMQTTDEGTNDKGDTWISVSTGDAAGWSTPICITNNAGRETWWAKDTGILHGVAGGSRFGPGQGAAVVDKTGHIVVALIDVETGSFAMSNGGVVYFGGSTSKPRLHVYRF